MIVTEYNRLMQPKTKHDMSMLQLSCLVTQASENGLCNSNVHYGMSPDIHTCPCTLEALDENPWTC